VTSFTYSARGRDGKTLRGVRAAADEAALARDLALESLFLLKAGPAQAASGRFGGPRVKRKELIAFMIHLGSSWRPGSR
jgi:type II secretory pathway component PulF